MSSGLFIMRICKPGMTKAYAENILSSDFPLEAEGGGNVVTCALASHACESSTGHFEQLAFRVQNTNLALFSVGPSRSHNRPVFAIAEVWTVARDFLE